MTLHCEWCPFPDCTQIAQAGRERVARLAAQRKAQTGELT